MADNEGQFKAQISSPLREDAAAEPSMDATRDTQQVKEEDNKQRRVCNFFQRGHCKFGGNCQNLHVTATTAPVFSVGPPASHASRHNFGYGAASHVDTQLFPPHFVGTVEGPWDIGLRMKPHIMERIRERRQRGITSSSTTNAEASTIVSSRREVTSPRRRSRSRSRSRSKSRSRSRSRSRSPSRGHGASLRRPKNHESQRRGRETGGTRVERGWDRDRRDARWETDRRQRDIKRSPRRKDDFGRDLDIREQARGESREELEAELRHLEDAIARHRGAK